MRFVADAADAPLLAGLLAVGALPSIVDDACPFVLLAELAVLSAAPDVRRLSASVQLQATVAAYQVVPIVLFL